MALRPRKTAATERDRLIDDDDDDDDPFAGARSSDCASPARQMLEKQQARYKQGLVSTEEVDPSTVPSFTRITYLKREHLTDVDHWGRSAITKYSALHSLAGDHLRSVSGVPNEGDTTHYKANLSKEMLDWNATITNALELSHMARNAKLDYERTEKWTLDISRDPKTLIHEAESDTEKLEALSTLLIRLGYYVLNEYLWRTRWDALKKEGLHITNPRMSSANYNLGCALQRQGLHADAEVYLTQSYSGRIGDMDGARTMVESCIRRSLSVRKQMRFAEACEIVKKAVDLTHDWDPTDLLYIHARSEYCATLARHAKMDQAREIAVPDDVVHFDADNHDITACLLENQSYYECLNGDVDRGSELAQTLVLSLSSYFGVTHPETLRAKRGNALFLDSEQAFDDIYTAWCKVYGESSVEAQCALHDIGIYHVRQDSYQTARDHLEKAYAALQKSCTIYHRLTCDTASKIADTYVEEERPGDAEWFVRSVHSAMEANFGVHGCDTRKAMNNVACALFRRFQTQEANELWKRSIVPWVQEYSSHSSTMDEVICMLVLQNYCFLLSHLNNSPAQLKEWRRKIWTEWERLLGPEHPNTLTAMENYGICLRDLRQLEDAKEVFRKLLAMRREVRGDMHPDTLSAEFHLAATLKIALEFTEAKELHDRAYEARLEVLGPHHTDTSASEYYISLWYLAKRDLEQSDYYQRLCIAGYSQSYGPDHYWTLNAVNTLGNILSARDDDASNHAAGECFEHAAKGLAKLFGEIHVETLRPLIKLAYHKKRIKDFKSAIMLWKRVVHDSEELFGTYSPKTVFAVCNLISTFNAAFLDDEGEEYYAWIRRGWDEIRKMPSNDMDPKDFHCLTVIQDMVKVLPETSNSSYASRLTKRVTLQACRRVDSALTFLGLS